MRNLAAYLLLILGGNKNPSGDDVKRVLTSAGLSTEQEAIDKLIAEVKGKDVWELIDQGKTKLAAVGGGAPRAGGASAPSAAPTAAAASKEDEKPAGKDAKKEESEESEGDMGFGLFD